MGKVEKSVMANTGYREKENVDNILFIGNGFDLSNGMKTSYTNYLDSLKIKKGILESIKLVYEFQGILMILESYMLKKYSSDNRFFLNNKISTKEYIEIFIIDEKCDQENFWNMFYSEYQTFETSFESLKIEDKMFYTYMTIYAKITKESNNIFPNIKFSNSLKKYIIKNRFEKFKDMYNSVKIYIEQKNIALFAIYIQILSKKIYVASEFYEEIKELELIGTNWIDIENILYENQFNFFRSTLLAHKNSNMIYDSNKYKYESFFQIFNKIFENESNLDDDFKKFKKSFANYIKVQQKNLKNKANISKFVNIIYDEFHFNKIYNFNYSNYINDIVKEIDSNILVDNIHGSVDDGEKIVFGTNHYLFKQDNEEHNKKIKEDEYTDILIANTEANYKLTKIYQVLELGDSRNSEILGKVNSLTILGHSIGKQDFEYMHTIIMTNPKEIVLNILYSSKVGNRAELTDAVYEMLGKYEELHGDVTIHKMILENRIKFIDMETFKEAN